MYTTTINTAINTVLVPEGAQVIRNEEFMWQQMMSSIRILSGKIPSRYNEIEYEVEGRSYYAILDNRDNLYIWRK